MPSMVLDAICLITQCNYPNDNMTQEQINFIDIMEELSSGRLRNDAISMSTLCGILTMYAENTDFENYTLDDLDKLFKNPENMRDVVKSQKTTEFHASHIYPVLDDLVDQWAERYSVYINILKEIEFDKLWESELLPTIEKEISKNKNYMKAWI